MIRARVAAGRSTRSATGRGNEERERGQGRRQGEGCAKAAFSPCLLLCLPPRPLSLLLLSAPFHALAVAPQVVKVVEHPGIAIEQVYDHVHEIDEHPVVA